MKSERHQHLAGLEVIRLGRTDWRVNAAHDAGDAEGPHVPGSGEHPGRLLGYIERQRGGRYEVVWMSDPVRWGYAASFDDALVAFEDSVRFPGEIFDQRVGIAGRPRSGTPARRTTWLKPTGRSRVA